MIDVDLSTLEDALNYLEKEGYIRSRSGEKYTTYHLISDQLNPRLQRTLDTRKQIYDFIRENPGMYLSKIAEHLELSIQLTDYHLNHLLKNNLIVTSKDPRGHYKRYYVVDSDIEQHDRKILGVLRQEIPLSIVLLLLQHHTLQHKQLWKKLHILPSNLSYHLNKLIEYDIVTVYPHGENKGYHLKNREDIIRILEEYEVMLSMEMTVDSFSNIWKDFSLSSLKE